MRKAPAGCNRTGAAPVAQLPRQSTGIRNPEGVGSRPTGGFDAEVLGIGEPNRLKNGSPVRGLWVRIPPPPQSFLAEQSYPLHVVPRPSVAGLNLPVYDVKPA